MRPASSSATAICVYFYHAALLHAVAVHCTDCLHCFHAAVLVAVFQRCYLCHGALLHVVAVLLHRYRPFLSCCSSSSATAPIASIAIMLLCYR
ncbi:hypothetical protein PR003_g26251 [Phytophthora rubi]|uniref:Uncharacterized protein n=1 Tax=Phytophthora rubi TaxID=129364 RepID=A0A6A3I340_9STRA|nr:hypothetical protein PR002_g25073 [Phytophthora rubi]KAE8977797.1 hypothetical protein PR001_g25031 [Phytophthora rubi]KAE9286685.1 hypothetical protein PR003_g26251 [Phytophthora rubi]